MLCIRRERTGGAGAQLIGDRAEVDILYNKTHGAHDTCGVFLSLKLNE